MKHEPIDAPYLTKLQTKHHSREALTKMLLSVDVAETFAMEIFQSPKPSPVDVTLWPLRNLYGESRPQAYDHVLVVVHA